jgi:2'-5' RNA ligase
MPEPLNRCILIFPDIPNIGVIEDIRARYDPLHKLVRPHITLVFPFVSELDSKAVEVHVKSALAGVEPFGVTLQGVSAQRGFGNYLLLNVHTGKNTLKEMHRSLYTGVLETYKPHWCRTFEPHMTVGKVEDAALFELAVTHVQAIDDLFETCVDTVSVEIISEDGHSTIESFVKLSAV